MQAEELYSSNVPGVRDRYMAENVKWILDHEPPGTKIMLWAHNGHIWTADTVRGDPMGKVLRRLYGEEMVTCGFAFNQGSFRAYPQTRVGVRGRSTFLVGPAPSDTWESALTATRLPLFAVDLRSAANGVAGEWLQKPHRMRIIGAVYNEFAPNWYLTPVLRNSFDVIFFVNQTSSSQENPQPPRTLESDFGRG